MIEKIFCHHCGLQLNLGDLFCRKCGTSQVSLSEKPPVEQKITPKVQTTFKPRVIGADDDDDDDPIDHLQSLNININSLEVDIKGYESNAKETVRGVMQEGIAIGVTAATQQPLSRGSNVPTNQKEFLEQFKKEAGTIKLGESITVGG